MHNEESDGIGCIMRVDGEEDRNDMARQKHFLAVHDDLLDALSVE